MNIGLDWDNTFTRDPKLWQKFIDLFHEHKIWIVTSRGEDIPIESIPEGIQGIVYCNFICKKDATNRRGILIDIWIDDDPKWIIQDW